MVKNAILNVAKSHSADAHDKVTAFLKEKNIKVETPKEQKFGDMSTNVAMIFSKIINIPTRELAELLVKEIEADKRVFAVNIAGAGFVNWSLSKDYVQECLKSVLSLYIQNAEYKYGFQNFGNAQRVNVEYVSANPTGPLHAGHARGAVVGDVLANLLNAVGYDVTKEYYINDAGNQVNCLARSVYHRYSELLGQQVGDLPDNCYPGEYVFEIAKKLIEIHGDKFLNKPESEWLETFKQFAVDDQLDCIKHDLAEIGIHHDVFVSEADILKKGLAEETLNYLKKKDLVYSGVLTPPKGKVIEDWEPKEQTLFKSTQFGDEVDRPLIKSDGHYTYFASDIAYHKTKIERKYDKIINFWGADHGGYVKRMEAAVNALADDKNSFEFKVKICQLVKFIRSGKDVKMSKRAGTFVSLRDVINAVGRDVVRFIMLTRRDDVVLDFDFDQVVSQSRENPVFYVQYAHARICSVFRQYKETFGGDINTSTLSQAINSLSLSDEELDVVKTLLHWPKVISIAAHAFEPHKIAFYLQALASKFHTLWNAGKTDLSLRFINRDNQQETLSKMIVLYLIKAVMSVGFEIIGVIPVEELR